MQGHENIQSRVHRGQEEKIIVVCIVFDQLIFEYVIRKFMFLMK